MSIELMIFALKCFYLCPECWLIIFVSITLGEKCPYLELFWFIFSRIWTEYGEMLRIFPYSVRMRENTDQKGSEYGHFSRSVSLFNVFQLSVQWCFFSYFSVFVSLTRRLRFTSLDHIVFLIWLRLYHVCVLSLCECVQLILV